MSDELEKILVKHFYIYYHGEQAHKNQIEIIEANKEIYQWAKQMALGCMPDGERDADELYINGYDCACTIFKQNIQKAFEVEKVPEGESR